MQHLFLRRTVGAAVEVGEVVADGGAGPSPAAVAGSESRGYAGARVRSLGGPREAGSRTSRARTGAVASILPSKKMFERHSRSYVYKVHDIRDT